MIIFFFINFKYLRVDLAMNLNLKKNKKVKFFLTILVVIISSFLQCFVVQAFINSSNLLSTGFTGVAILIDKIAGIYGKSIPISLSILLLNFPVALLCYKGISRRFTLFSIAQVFTLSLFLNIFNFDPIFEDTLLNAIFGGVLAGIGIVMLLEFGASSGGTDFIALYISNKKGVSIWKYVFMGNVVLLCIFGSMFGWNYAGYSIIYQYVLTNTISTFHQRYQRVTLQITTSKSEEIIEAYVNNFRHGISCIDAIGGYSKSKMCVLHTVISAYEVKDVISLLKEVDPYIIVNLFKTDQFVGRFYQAPID